jgi:hypothetical protein
MRTLVFGLLVVALSGCSFYARSADDYRNVTRQLVQTRQSQLTSCYERVLKADEGAGGDVAIAFEVEAKTGKLHSPSIVPARTTASDALGECVMTALDGLVLEPPDQRTAQAEFVWSFERG